MKKSRFTDSQIAFILRQAEEGTSVEEVCRKAGISAQTYYRETTARLITYLLLIISRDICYIRSITSDGGDDERAHFTPSESRRLCC